MNRTKSKPRKAGQARRRIARFEKRKRRRQAKRKMEGYVTRR